MKLSVRYQILSKPPESLTEYLAKIHTLFILMSNRNGMTRPEAREHANYACESPDIIPLGSHVQDHYYTTQGWRRKMVIHPKMSSALRDGAPL